MKRNYSFLLMIPIAFCLAACGGSESSSSDVNLTKAAGGTASSTIATAARFSKDIGKGCELLTADLVAATLNFPAEDLKQTKVMGCMYTWRNDTEQLNAGISMVRVHKNTAGAVAWFARTTANRTAAEMQAEFDQVAKSLSERNESATPATKSMANAILSTAASVAVSFEDVAGVGDEARIDATGTIHVRVDNLTLIVAAYKGPREPQGDYAGMNPQQIMAAAKDNSTTWAAETLAQRKADGTQIALAVVDNL